MEKQQENGQVGVGGGNCNYGRKLENYRSTLSMVLGVCQIVIGLVIIAMCAVMLSYGFRDIEGYIKGPNVGISSGVFTIVAGIMALLAGNYKTQNHIVNTLQWSMVAIVMDVILAEPAFRYTAAWTHDDERLGISATLGIFALLGFASSIGTAIISLLVLSWGCRCY